MPAETSEVAPDDDILVAGEVAPLFRVSERTIGLWAEAGKIPSWRTPGGQRRFSRKDIEALIAAQRSAEATA